MLLAQEKQALNVKLAKQLGINLPESAKESEYGLRIPSISAILSLRKVGIFNTVTYFLSHKSHFSLVHQSLQVEEFVLEDVLLS